MIVIRGARCLTREGWADTDVAIDGDTVSHLGAVPENPDESIDGSGLILGPGFVDLHTHLRDPGQTWKEDLATGTAAAARGGFCAVVAMPNTAPAIDSGESARRVLQRAAGEAVVEVAVAGALSIGRAGSEMAHLDDLYAAGARLFTDDGDTLVDGGLLRRILQYVKDLPGAVVAQHAEDPSISDGGHVNQGRVSDTLGLTGLPSSAETSVIARDLEIVAEVGGRYHVQHISTGRGVDLVRDAKAAGLAVTAEVTPHHLALTEDDVAGLDTDLKMYPPLRTAADRDALCEGLRDGTIDAIATDHAPHTAEEKDVPFEEAPRGVTGLETALAVGLAALGGDLDILFERMSVTPARIAGLDRHGAPIGVGSPANLVLLDPGRAWVADSFSSRSSNSPFRGQKLEGRVMATIVEGRVAYGDGT